MAKLCNAALAFFRAQPGGTGRNFTQPIVTRRLQSLLCCAARASFRLKSVTVAGAKLVLTGPNAQSSLNSDIASQIHPLLSHAYDWEMFHYIWFYKACWGDYET